MYYSVHCELFPASLSVSQGESDKGQRTFWKVIGPSDGDDDDFGADSEGFHSDDYQCKEKYCEIKS